MYSKAFDSNGKAVACLDTGDSRDLRILIVAENASARFGGEAILPLQLFRRLCRLGIEAWMIVHSRNRDEISDLMPSEIGRIHFIPDSALNRFLWRLDLI